MPSYPRTTGVLRAVLMAAPLVGALIHDGAGAQARAAVLPKTLIVAPYGSDAAPGTAGHPRRTVARAVAMLPKGGSVQLRAGHYAERVRLGPTVHDLTIEPYRSEHPVLDGRTLTPPDDRSAMIEITGSRTVTIRGIEITGYRSTRLAAVPTGIIVQGGASRVTLQRNHVHHLGNTNATRGSVEINAHGIEIYGNSPSRPITDLAVIGNEVDHLTLGASESVVLNGNVDRWQVTANSVHDNNNIGIDAAGYENTLPGRFRYNAVNRPRNGVIADNTVRNIRARGNPSYYQDGQWCDCSDGIYVDGGTHIRIERNRLAGNDIGIEVASENTGGSADHVVIADNTIRTSRYTGISTGGYCNGAASCGGTRTGSAHDNVFVNNTLYANNANNDGSPEISIQYFAYRNRFENNIVSATDAGHVLLGTVPGADSDGVSTRNTIDHNLYYVSGGNPSTARFASLGGEFTGWATYRTATGLDAHSRFLDPRLAAPASGDLHLSATSPALDAGVALPTSVAGTLDVDRQRRTRGTRIDLGADERR